MNRLISIVERSLDLARRTYKQIHILYPVFVLWGGLLPIALSMIFLLTGFDWGNKIGAVACVLISAWLGSHIIVLTTSAVAGAIADPKHPLAGGKDAIIKAYEGIRSYCLMLALWFFVLGTLPIGRNFGSVITALVAIIIIVMITIEWNLALKFYKKAIQVYSYSILIISIILVIPPTVYNRIIGSDPVAYFRVLPADEEIPKVEETAADVKSAYDKRILAGLSNSINPETGHKVNMDQLIANKVAVEVNLQKVKMLKEERNRNSLVGLYKRTRDSFRNLDGVEEDADNPEIKIVKNSEKNWDVYFYTDQPTRILSIWPAGRQLCITSPEPIMMNSMAGGEKMDLVPVIIGDTRIQKENKPLYLKYKEGGKVTMNFS